MDIFNEETEIDSETAYKLAKLLPDNLFYILQRKINSLIIDKEPITLEKLMEELSKREANRLYKKVLGKPKFERQISKKVRKKMAKKKEILEKADTRLKEIKKDIEDRNS